MISTALLAFALAASSFGGAVLSADRSRRDLVVNDVTPAVLDFYAGYTNVAGWIREDPIEVARGDLWDFPFEMGIEYAIVKVSIDYSESDPYVDKVYFSRFESTATHYGSSVLPYGVYFSMLFYSPSTNYYYMKVNGYKLEMNNKKGTVGAVSIGYDSVYCPLRPYWQSQFTMSTSGPYYGYLDEDASTLSLIDGIATTLIARNPADVSWQDGYAKGYQDGRDYQAPISFEEGRQYGYDEVNASGNLFTNLFGSLVNVPISVLNGLSPLAIWDVPIISLILTFVACGAVLFLIKKVL